MPLADTLEKPVLKLSTGTRLGLLRLRVTNVDMALRIWRDMVGLHVIERDDKHLVLGIGATPLIHLDASATEPVEPKSLGLYHIAIHVPARKELARIIARLIEAKIYVSPTDHLVSEAAYLWDLDGNGIEITFETPWRGKFVEGSDGFYCVTTDGKTHSGREPIDLHDLFAELNRDDDLGAPMPEGTRLGHIHLHVAGLDPAMHFYAGLIGFQPQLLSSRFGMGDVRTDYEPHILAFNTWSGPAARQSNPAHAGLTSYEIVLASGDDLNGIVGRLEQADYPFKRQGNEAVALKDPAGNALTLLVG